MAEFGGRFRKAMLRVRRRCRKAILGVCPQPQVSISFPQTWDDESQDVGDVILSTEAALILASIRVLHVLDDELPVFAVALDAVLFAGPELGGAH